MKIYHQFGIWEYDLSNRFRRHIAKFTTPAQLYLISLVVSFCFTLMLGGVL